MSPEGLISRIIRRIEPDPPREPEQSAFKKSGGWGSERESAGGAHSHLSPDETAAAQRAGAEALVQLQAQTDANPGGPVHSQHIS